VSERRSAGPGLAGMPPAVTLPPPAAAAGAPAFAHASEAELTRILDFYGVRWEYEPHVFPILWNMDGDVLESFSPDFYLPDLDLYVELTTLRQKLVRKKNRKLRRLRELYPDLRVKLFYAKDFRALMLKYSRVALADELSGAAGQVTPDRSASELLTGPFGVAPFDLTAVAEPLPAMSPERIPTASRRRRPRGRATLRPTVAEAQATDR
jgi:hypothetical protein